MHIFRHTVNLEILEENLHDGIAIYGDSLITDVTDVTDQIIALDVYYFYVAMQ